MSVVRDAKLAIERIDVATQESQIAVFKHEGVKSPKNQKFKWDIEPGLECLFASTVMTNKRIKDGDDRYIGSFDRSMDLVDVKNQLVDELYALEQA